MKTIPLNSWIIGLCMVAAALLSMAMTPTKLIAANAPKINLEAMIPKQFGDWQQLQELDVIAVNPEVQANLDKIYQQTLSRTYINSRGEQIMLSLAYGGDQDHTSQVHKPEVCYPAQGFQIQHMTKGLLNTNAGSIPVMHMVAIQGSRVEPITYWIRVGDTVVRGALEQNMARIKYGLTGKVPDGLLVRVSSISNNAQNAYHIQQAFITAMLSALPLTDRDQLIGRNTL